jgi:hypothetical protein
VIFNGTLPDVNALSDEIKAFSCVWFVGRSGCKSCIPFSSWCLDPMVCFQSI